MEERNVTSQDLIKACKENNLDGVKRALDDGADIEAKDNNGWTALILASNEGNKEIVELLLDRGADVETTIKDSLVTALIIAIDRGHKEIKKLLLENGADIEAKKNNGWTALISASIQGDKEIVELLLENGADIEAKKNNGWTALISASIQGHKEIVELLLDRSADIEAKDNRGMTALIWASYKGNKEIAELLLDNGADIEAKYNRGMTALIWASDEGNKEIVELLLDNGADIEAKDNDNWTALYWSVVKGNIEIVQLLVENGANIEAKNNNGWTALIFASYKGNKEIVELLLDRGADIEAKSNNGLTALIFASYKGNKEIVELLLDRSADIEAKDNNGLTALIGASDEGHKEIVELLLDRGADIEAKDNNGLTALIRASIQGNKEIVELLLDRGADIEVKDNDGWTALILASNEGNKEIVELLLDRGADIEKQCLITGSTPLIIASENGNVEIVKLLLDKGADIEANKKNIINIILRKRISFIKNKILKYIFNILINILEFIFNFNSNSNTGLRKASENNHKKVVELLVKNGADIESISPKYYKDKPLPPKLVKFIALFYKIIFYGVPEFKNIYKDIESQEISIKPDLNNYILYYKYEIEEKMKMNNPQKLVETLTKFTIAKSNLKHTTHHWDMEQREGKWKDINSFLEDIKEDWEDIDDDLKNISPNLHSTIEAFLFNDKLGEKNPESNQSCVYSWGEYHLKIGWSSPELIKWCNENPKESPFNYMLDNSKREVIEGVAIDRFSDVINIFKNEIEIRSDKNQLKKIFRNLKKTLKSDFILSIDVSLEGVEFYTDVESFKESLVLIFKMMQERESSPQIKVWAEKFIDKGYIELYITQIASSTRKEPQEIINKIQKDDGGDMGKILSKLSSLCDWSIAYPFDEKKSYTIDLLDSETNQITFEEANNIEGFTHILRFYK